MPRDASTATTNCDLCHASWDYGGYDRPGVPGVEIRGSALELVPEWSPSLASAFPEFAVTFGILAGPLLLEGRSAWTLPPRATGTQETLAPVAPIERPILDSLGEMGDCQALGSFKVGDGSSHFQDAVVGPSGKSLLLHGAFEEPFGVGAQLAVGANLARRHLRVGIDVFFGFGEALLLKVPCGKNPGADLGGALGGR